MTIVVYSRNKYGSGKMELLEPFLSSLISVCTQAQTVCISSYLPEILPAVQVGKGWGVSGSGRNEWSECVWTHGAYMLSLVLWCPTSTLTLHSVGGKAEGTLITLTNCLTDRSAMWCQNIQHVVYRCTLHTDSDHLLKVTLTYYISLHVSSLRVETKWL